jgi:hypothetical protein
MAHRMRATLAAFAIAAPPTATAAAQAPNPPASPTTFSISAYTWHEMQRMEVDGGRAYQAFANVRRVGGDRVRYYLLFFSSGLSRVLALEPEVDCVANTMRLVAGGGTDGNVGTLHAQDEAPRPTGEGTVARQSIRLVCDGAGWRPVADPFATGNAFIGR